MTPPRGRPTVAITVGEPAGIGPELVAMLAERHAASPFGARLVVVGDRDLLAARARRIGLAPRYADYDPAGVAPTHGIVEIWHHPVALPPTPGHPDPSNAASVIATLRAAAQAALRGTFGALVTAPVQKSAIMDAGIPFTGHTEFFADESGTSRVVMMLVGGEREHPLRVALVTTHLPLAEVPSAVTREAVRETLTIVDAELRTRFGIDKPRIAVCGLNPHAGEGGHLGLEEQETIGPAIVEAIVEGIDATGPLPADTVFVPEHAHGYDVIVAMYHDQGLPVLKAASFGQGINVTLGLPFVRTSVDHGTALDLSRSDDLARTADPGSLVAAVELAIELARRAGT